MAIARYTFLPWLRRGIANRIQAGAGAGASRATLTVALSARSDVSSTPIPPVTVRLVGPGDITSVHPHQVIRTEPRALSADDERGHRPFRRTFRLASHGGRRIPQLGAQKTAITPV